MTDHEAFIAEVLRLVAADKPIAATDAVVDRIYLHAETQSWDAMAALLDAVPAAGMAPNVAYVFHGFTHEFSSIPTVAAARDRFAERLRPWFLGQLGEERTARALRLHNAPPRAAPPPKPPEEPIARKRFADVAEAYRGLLRKMIDPPPSDGVMAAPIVGMIREYVARLDAMADVDVWNAYKRLLDVVVHTGGGSAFVVRLLDLEAWCDAPEGGYAQADGSIAHAPRRAATARG
mgnify:FL=1